MFQSLEIQKKCTWTQIASRTYSYILRPLKSTWAYTPLCVRKPLIQIYFWNFSEDSSTFLLTKTVEMLNNLFLKGHSLKTLIMQLLTLRLEWVECPLKTPWSILEIVSTFSIHSDMVELRNGLWGWAKLNRSSYSSKVLHFSNLLKYLFKTATTNIAPSSSGYHYCTTSFN